LRHGCRGISGLRADGEREVVSGKGPAVGVGGFQGEVSEGFGARVRMIDGRGAARDERDADGVAEDLRADPVAEAGEDAGFFGLAFVGPACQET
jgi:hypothetical protein